MLPGLARARRHPDRAGAARRDARVRRAERGARLAAGRHDHPDRLHRLVAVADRSGRRPAGEVTISAAETALEPGSPTAHRVGWGFISLYALAYIGTILVFLAPLLVSLALKVNSLVGIEQAPNSLALVAGIGALLAMFANPFFGKMSDRTTSRLGMRRPWMVIGLVGGSARHPRRRAGAQHPGRPDRMVHRPAVLQRPARRPGGGAAGPGPDRSTRPGLRCPGRLPAHRVGERHLPGPAVHRQPARHVPGPVRDRRVLHPALRGHAERSPAGQGGQADLVAAGVRQHVLRQPAEEPGLRLGLRQPLHARPGLRLPDHLPGLLPAGQDRQRRGRRAHDRYSSAPSPSPSSSSPRPSSAAGSPTGRADGRSSSSPRRSCTAWRCS